MGGLSERFGLENAAEQLTPWFDRLELHRYADRLARGAFTVRREKGVVIGERRLDLGL